MAKRIFVTDLSGLDRVDEEVFLVSTKQVSNTKQGNPYLRLKLGDRTGEIEAIRWDASQAELDAAMEGEYVIVNGKVGTYRESPQIVIEAIARWGGEVDPSDFLRQTPFDIDAMMHDLRVIAETVSNIDLALLLRKLFGDDGFMSRFRSAPAAVGKHHAYVGGLLEHTLAVTRASAALAKLYPEVDADILITGAILHDIGKTEELAWSNAITFTDAGNFVGHVTLGAIMVSRLTMAIDGFDSTLDLLLQHMILSHHGELLYGAPVEPRCAEAQLLHFADNIDAKTFMFLQAVRESRERGETGTFTQRQPTLERRVFKGMQ